MQENYPQSIPCAFYGFPAGIEVRMGSLASALIPGASLGSKFLLYQTPKSGVAQGDYTAGSALPDYRMIYTDTGGDDDFTLKVTFIGWGTFYLNSEADSYLRFQVEKGITITTSSVSEVTFTDTFDCETLIPKTADYTALFDYNASSVLNVDNETATYDDNANALITIGGITYQLKDYLVLSVHGSVGGNYNVSMIGGKTIIW